MYRHISPCLSRALIVFAAPLLICTQAFAYGSDKANFSGNWQLDSARSPEADAAAISLIITDEPGKFTYERSMKTRDGKEVVSKFSCPTTASQCDFDENGHKAKLSMWHDGSKLVLLKTDGPKQDATVERSLELSPDGNTLTVHLTNLDLDKDGKAKTLIFTKQSAPEHTASR